MGFAKICLKISYPEIVSHCPWGKTTRREEIFASKIPSLKGKISFLGVDDLRYNNIQALVEAIGINKENLCLDCLF
jgi:glutamine phosphoribosylpyrophosphate amidotransferase